MRSPIRAGWMLCLLTVLAPAAPGHALTARLRFEALVGSTIPYLNQHNERATLAWGASYQLMAYVEMFGRFGQATYADKAARLIDSLLKQRDDARKVKDYRGVSAACWRNLHYQPAQEPYCYVVHSGMLTYPMARFLEHLKRHAGVASQKAYDGATYQSKAASYLKRIEETVAAHADQWRNKGSSQGYYAFRNASFMRFKGQAMPLNQQNALGRTLTALTRLTQDATHKDRAARLCAYFKSYLKRQGRGYVWNYWPTAYQSPGEDISHASINASFAVECKRAGLSFSSGDLLRMAYALFDNSYKHATSWTKFVGGGSVDAKYAQQIGRWLPLVEAWPPLYGPIRSYYDLLYGKNATASGSILLSHAYLAVYEPRRTHHGFYHVDWAQKSGYKQATAYGANLLALPSDAKAPALIQLRYAASGPVEHQQYDGTSYHTILKLATTSSFRTEWFVMDPRWWHPYSKGQGLFQFRDLPFVAGKGIKVVAPTPLKPPQITSTAATQGETGKAYRYDADGKASPQGSPPFRWQALSPPGLTIDPNTGQVAWTPTQAGVFQAEIRLENDVAVVSQHWKIQVTAPTPPPEPRSEPSQQESQAQEPRPEPSSPEPQRHEPQRAEPRGSEPDDSHDASSEPGLPDTSNANETPSPADAAPAEPTTRREPATEPAADAKAARPLWAGRCSYSPCSAPPVVKHPEPEVSS